jgi:hypothetical protein
MSHFFLVLLKFTLFFSVSSSFFLNTVILTTVVLAVVIFVINVVYLLPSWEHQIIIGIVSFITFLSLMSFFFFPKVYLCIIGSDLNSHYQIVKRRESNTIRASEKIHASGRQSNTPVGSYKFNPRISTYLVKQPPTIEDTEILIEDLRGHLMRLTQIALNDHEEYETVNGDRRPKRSSKSRVINILEAESSIPV